MKSPFILLLFSIIAVIFGANAPAPRDLGRFPIITGQRFVNIISVLLVKLVVDSVDFGPLPEYDGLLVQDINSVEKMKRKLVKTEIFGEYKGNIEVDKVIVNGLDYGPYTINNIIFRAIPC